MSINLTLIGQMITFLVLVWFTMRYIWPPIMKAMHERQTRIADGLAAADRGEKALELAEHKAREILREAKQEASHIIEQANKRSGQILEEAREHARQESQNILEAARQEVQQMMLGAKTELRAVVADLVIAGAEKVIEKEIDPKVHQKLLDSLMNELTS